MHGDQIRFESDKGLVINLDAGASERFKPQLNKPVTLGIRPEHYKIECDASSASAHNQIAIGGAGEVTISMIEPLGEHVNVHGHAGDETIHIRAPFCESLNAGDQICVSLNSAMLHVFERNEAARRL